MVDSLEVVIEKIDNLQEDVGAIRLDVKEIRKSIYGNGDKEGGMTGRLRLVENWIESQTWFQRLMIAVLVSEGIGILYIIVKHVFTTP